MTKLPRNLTLLTVACIVPLAPLAGCDDYTYDAPGGIVIYDAGPGGAPDGAIRQNRPVMSGEIAPVYGFKGPEAKVEFYYMGEVDKVGNTVPVNPIYFFYDEDNRPLHRLAEDGTRLVGWHPIVDIVPTKRGYSPFWRVHNVRVKGRVDDVAMEELRKLPKTKETCQMDAVCPEGQKCVEERCRAPIDIGDYPLDGIKSLETLENSKLAITETDTIINCPVVDANAKLLKGLADPDKPFPKVQLWYRRLKAVCYLMEGGKAVMGQGAADLPQGKEKGKAPPVMNAYFIRQELDFGAGPKVPVLAERHMLLTEHLPGDPGYSPLVSETSVVVGKDHKFKDLRSVAEARQQKLPLRSTGKLHNLAVRGTIPACKDDDDCKATGGKVDPPLKCSQEQGYCSPPFAKLHEDCRRGVKECDPKGGPDGAGLVCIGWRGREKYFCYHSCDSDKQDENPAADRDSRCGSIKGFQCYALRRTDPTQPNGFCYQECSPRAGDKEEVMKQCISATCGDGKLQHGEVCDDGNLKNGDGCNEFCTLSTYVRCDSNADCKGTEDNPTQQCKEPFSGQGSTFCLPSDKEKDETKDDDKYRVTCTSFGACSPPDERAEWLGKKEEDE